jgi:dynein heavy chain
VFVTNGIRWALNVDPQIQANKWLKKMHDDLIVADVKDADYLKKIEIAITKGQCVLLQDVGENIDPTLDNVLQKSLIQHGRRWAVKFGQNEIEYNTKFRLFITTRLPNPHYTPEISTKVNVVNFIVVETGLEEQCLGIVVRAEQPQLETQKNEKLQAITNGKSEILRLEDSILARLSDDSIDLLEDEELVQQLAASKETSDRVKVEIENAEANMKRIDDTREGFRSCGKKAAVLFFCLNDLAKINPMYQFSLDWYKELFARSIQESKELQSQDRNETIMKVHKLNVYNQSCRSLFESHKLLLALQMYVKLMLAEGKIDAREYDFFLRGGTVMDTKGRTPKPSQDWLTDQAWDNVTELERLLPETFTGLPAAVSLNFKEWQHWFSSDKPMPEDAQLPGEWETKCDDNLKKMIVLRCFRPDRVTFAIRNFVAWGMKSSEFITSKPTSIGDIFEDSIAT